MQRHSTRGPSLFATTARRKLSPAAMKALPKGWYLGKERTLSRQIRMKKNCQISYENAAMRGLALLNARDNLNCKAAVS